MSIEDIKRARRAEYRASQKAKWLKKTPRNISGYDLDELLDNGAYASLSTMKKNEIRRFTKFNKDDSPAFLVLHGGVGLGKTALSVSIVNKMFDYGVVSTAEYIACPEAMLRMSYGENDGSGTPESIIKEMVRPDVLIIDDVGAGSDVLTQSRKMGFWSVIDQRWSNHKATILTSNMPESSITDRPGMKQWFGDSTWDRISGNMSSIHFTGNSMRYKEDV